jgi:hypothetical protein
VEHARDLSPNLWISLWTKLALRGWMSMIYSIFACAKELFKNPKLVAQGCA